VAVEAAAALQQCIADKMVALQATKKKAADTPPINDPAWDSMETIILS
jgi:hypothetical protein